jgi:hypothetical protein
MANIKREIDSLRAKIARLEKEQKKAEQQKQALDKVQSQIDKILKDNGISFEAYVRSHHLQISRVLAKIERVKDKSATPIKRVSKKKVASKQRRGRKIPSQIKIPAGQYGNLPSDPDLRFEVKEKGPRPKALKAYAEEIGLEAFLAKCRIDG